MKNRMLSMLWVVGVGLGICQAGVAHATNSCPNDDELINLCNHWSEVQSQWDNRGIWPIADDSAEAVLVEQLEYLCVTATTTRSSSSDRTDTTQENSDKNSSREKDCEGSSNKDPEATSSGPNPGGGDNTAAPQPGGGSGAPLYWGGSEAMIFDGLGPSPFGWTAKDWQDESSSRVPDSLMKNPDSNKKEQNNPDSKTGYHIPYQF